jgi:hypothetical protein
MVIRGRRGLRFVWCGDGPASGLEADTIECRHPLRGKEIEQLVGIRNADRKQDVGERETTVAGSVEYRTEAGADVGANDSVNASWGAIEVTDDRLGSID